MIRAALLLLCLAACGADGPPERPGDPPPPSGVSVSGTVAIGVSGRN